jgi:hypothetical protein
MATLDDLAGLIARMEGYYVPGTIAQTNHNPGNLRYAGQTGAIGQNKGYAVFASDDAGWAALNRQLELNASRGDTLEQFINRYAPPSENDTTNYLQYLVKGLGVGASTLLSQLSGQTEPAPYPESGEQAIPAELATLSPTMTLVLIASIVGIGLLIASRD